MTRKTALLLSAALTALVLGAFGILTFQARAQHTDVTLATGRSPDQAADWWADRERTYQERLGQANTQLTDAYAELTRVQEQNRLLLEREQQYRRMLQQPTARPQTDQSAVATGTGAIISKNDAKQIAVAHIGGGNAGKIELEQEAGQAAYEVRVGSAEVVVDAYTGRVLRVGGTRNEQKERGD